MNKTFLNKFKENKDYIMVLDEESVCTLLPITFSFVKEALKADFNGVYLKDHDMQFEDENIWKHALIQATPLISISQDSKVYTFLSKLSVREGMKSTTQINQRFYSEELRGFRNWTENEQLIVNTLSEKKDLIDTVIDEHKDSVKNYLGDYIESFLSKAESKVDELLAKTSIQPREFNACLKFLSYGNHWSFVDGERVYPRFYEAFQKLASFKSLFINIYFNLLPNFDFSKLILTKQTKAFTDLSGMFSNVDGIDADLSHWDFSKPVYMHAFASAACRGRIVVGNWKVDSLSFAFGVTEDFCVDISKVKNLKLSNTRALCDYSRNLEVITKGKISIPKKDYKEEILDQRLAQGARGLKLNLELDDIIASQLKFSAENNHKDYSVVNSILSCMEYIKDESIRKDVSILYKQSLEQLRNPHYTYNGNFFTDVKLDTNAIASTHDDLYRFFDRAENITLDFSNAPPKTLPLLDLMVNSKNCHIILGKWKIKAIGRIFQNCENCSVDFSLCDFSEMEDFNEILFLSSSDCVAVWGNNKLPIKPRDDHAKFCEKSPLLKVAYK